MFQDIILVLRHIVVVEDYVKLWLLRIMSHCVCWGLCHNVIDGDYMSNCGFGELYITL